ncbi:MAG: universal stress protein [Acidimicrobiia bacterium]
MILLTLDTSELSEHAVPTAVELARRFGQPLHLLLVLDASLRPELVRHAGTERSLAEHADSYLTAVADRIPPDLSVSFSHQFALDAADAIIDAANQLDAALIVMATHGRTGWSRLLAGSVTEHVLRSSTVPVVAVPSAQHRA